MLILLMNAFLTSGIDARTIQSTIEQPETSLASLLLTMQPIRLGSNLHTRAHPVDMSNAGRRDPDGKSAVDAKRAWLAKQEAEVAWLAKQEPQVDQTYADSAARTRQGKPPASYAARGRYEPTERAHARNQHGSTGNGKRWWER
mmetsp:Transcript_99333/g.155338  ORF Transcript_99333/g.155338 Transcript_99333/m.155338 type:complete len:144 (+) Transcript_99333:72-503(+)